jgi:hypothetical protein
MTKKICLALIGVFACFSVFSQKEKVNDYHSVDTVFISFGEKLPESLSFKWKKSVATWSLENNTNSALNRAGTNADLSQLKFSEPGVYVMHFSGKVHEVHAGECDHQDGPMSYVIVVSDVKFVYQFDQISFSTALKSGVNNELIITVPVEMQSFTHKAFKLPKLTINGAGVNTHLTGQLTSSTVSIAEGITNLTFQLSGTVEKGTYIMLDFEDPFGQIQTYYHPIQIN